MDGNSKMVTQTSITRRAIRTRLAYQAQKPHKQRSRLGYIVQIEKNWGESILDIVKESIRPRQREEGDTLNYGAINKRELENDPKNWSDHLLLQLSQLSKRTRGEADRARALLDSAVSDRQATAGATRNSTKSAKELLRGDVQRINEALGPVPQHSAKSAPSLEAYSRSKKGPKPAQEANVETVASLGRKRKRDTRVDPAHCLTQDKSEMEIQQRISELEAEAGRKLAEAVMLKMELLKRQNATSMHAE